ncbi:MAG TPA: HD domain-containing phosphohydrolase [bacterium]
MRYCSLVELEPGMPLGRHITGSRGELLLGRGQILDTYFIRRLSELGFLGIFIEEPGFEEVQPVELVNSNLYVSTQILMGQCLDSLAPLRQDDASAKTTMSADFSERIRSGPKVPVARLRDQVHQVIEDVLEEASQQLSCLLLKAQGLYQMQHGTDTMIIAVLLGINFNMIYRELRQLALAALLHDVGKAALCEPGRANLTPSDPQYRNHPYVGAQIVLHSSDNTYIECATIQQHHERQDGLGFPDGLKGSAKSPASGAGYRQGEIYRLAEILSVADAYDVLTSGPYGTRLTPEQAIENITKRRSSEFNPYVVKTLAKMVQIFPVGSPVKILSTTNQTYGGCRGIVSQFHTEAPHQCDLVLTHDSTGQRVPPQKLGLLGDAQARLTLLL